MLIMSRKPGQMVYVSGPCWIKVTSLHESHAKIGFEAPPDVRILRGECQPFEGVSAPDSPESEVQKKAG